MSERDIVDGELDDEIRSGVAGVWEKLTPEQRKRVAILAARLRASDRPVWEFTL